LANILREFGNFMVVVSKQGDSVSIEGSFELSEQPGDVAREEVLMPLPSAPKKQSRGQARQKKSNGDISKTKAGGRVMGLEDSAAVQRVIEKLIKGYDRRGSGNRKYGQDAMRSAMIDIAVIGERVNLVAKRHNIPEGTLYNWRKVLMKSLRNHKVASNIYHQRAA